MDNLEIQIKNLLIYYQCMEVYRCVTHISLNPVVKITVDNTYFIPASTKAQAKPPQGGQ
jgi:hypothetical protein